MTTTKQYRITFYQRALARMDPLEFAWLLAKHYVEVTAKADTKPMIFVKCAYREMLDHFMSDVNAVFGPLVFDRVEALVDGCYVEI